MNTGKKNYSGLTGTPISTWLWLIITIIGIAIFTSFGPAEHSLGTHIRVVYLHGAWVWASIITFFLAALSGGVGLLIHRKSFLCWSSALGRTGLILWLTYLPLSLWAMQSNWNGLFMAEPRWRLAMVFAISGIMLQIGLSLANKPELTAGMNILYFCALIIALRNTPNVMHPGSPILQSDAWRIQLFFSGLVLLTLCAAWQVARWWYKREATCLTK